jgi:hypothetical protein
MIYEFKCRATGTVVMTQAPAEWLLRAIGKQPGPTGVITIAQMPAAIAAIRTAVEEELREIEEARRDSARQAGQPADEKGEQTDSAMVTHAQRAWPFVEMLEQAIRGQRDVTWGV